MGRIFYLFILLTCTQPLASQRSHFPTPGRLVELRARLIRSIGVGEREFPVVCADSSLKANARYAHDTIWIGQVQPDFHTEGDTLSLLYHEYIHHRLAGKYPVATDSGGLPVQWVTDVSYSYQPSDLEVNRELEQSRDFLAFLPDSIRAPQEARLREDLSRPRTRYLRYAPSNLAREELEAYSEQLGGEKNGWYELSPEAEIAIRIRIDQLTITLEQRVLYEKVMGLGPDGL